MRGRSSAWWALAALAWLPQPAVGQLLIESAPQTPVFDPPGQRLDLPKPADDTTADCCPGCGQPWQPQGLCGCGVLGRLRRLPPVPNLLHPPGRHRGIGRPLVQESWLYRPLSAGWFMGSVWEGAEPGFFGGYRFGWDRNYYWGAEMRITMASTPSYHTLSHWDLDVLYYPWGDSQWRPYLLLGLGMAHIGFRDAQGNVDREEVFALVPAVGLKYRYNNWLALRLELADNMAFGERGLPNTLHSLSLTGGLEVRFGGSRKAYWPWHPGRHYW